MPYWQIFYHIIWSTKNRAPILIPEIEPIIHDLLRTKAIGLGATVFAINGSIMSTWLPLFHPKSP